MQEIYMEKTSETGAKLFYEYKIEESTVKFRWGQIGSDNIQSDERTFTEGKNIGKKNEKSPEQCCIEDTARRARKKHEQGYEIIKGEGFVIANTGKTVKATDLSVPKPMKAQTLKDHWKKMDGVDEVYFQPKLDGNRGLINIRTGKMYSSGRKEMTHLPEIVEQVVKACEPIKDEVEWVDGELYSPKLVFNDLQSVLSTWKNTEKEGLAELRKEVKFYLFDVISDKPFSERLEFIKKLESNDKLQIVKTIVGHPHEAIGSQDDFIELPEGVVSLHDVFIEEGYEGIMIRTVKTLVRKDWVDKPYESKRSMQIFKHKLFDDEEFEVIGFEPEEHDPTKLGAGVLRMKNDDTFPARPAMTDDYKAEIWANQDKFIGRLATIKFQGKFADTGKPRFPRLTKFRLPEDITE